MTDVFRHERGKDSRSVGELPSPKSSLIRDTSNSEKGEELR